MSANMVLLLSSVLSAAFVTASVDGKKICVGEECDRVNGPEKWTPSGYVGQSMFQHPNDTTRACDYCSLPPNKGADNPYCQYAKNPKPNPATCGDVSKVVASVDQTAINSILSIHNTYRRAVAKGQEKRILKPGGVATDMLELVWNAELAQGAQLWANQCTFQHDSPSTCDFYVGQNLYISYDSKVDNKDPDWSAALGAWYEEVKDFAGSSVSKFSTGGGGDVGHFTQQIWATTHQIGCGYVTYLSRGNMRAKYYVCNYGPGGNMIGAPIYSPGQAVCSACPKNAKCDDGLCSGPVVGGTKAESEGSKGWAEEAAEHMCNNWCQHCN